MMGPYYMAQVTSTQFRDLMRRFLRQLSQLPEDVINNIVTQLRAILWDFQTLTEELSDATRRRLQ